MKRSFAALFFLILSLPLFAQSANEELAKKLLITSGQGDMGRLIVEELINSQSQNYPGMNAEFWEEMKAEVKSDTFIDMLAPIYAKYFTAEEMRQLIEFYNTPVGKKMVAVQPELSKEAMQAGQQWGMEIAMKIYNKLNQSK